MLKQTCISPLTDRHRRDYGQKSNIGCSIQRVFAYIPAVGETNTYARLHNVTVGTPFSLDEVMTFLEILLFLSYVDKGEYANYWGTQVDNEMLGKFGYPGSGYKDSSSWKSLIFRLHCASDISERLSGAYRRKKYSR